jgi:hypothetical protein
MGYPSVIIYLNNDVSSAVLAKLQQQLFVSDVYQVADFDNIISLDSSFIESIRGANKRIIVVANLSEEIINRDVADIVATIKMGLLYVLDSKVGPPGLALPVSSISIQKLLFKLGF